VDNLCHTLVGAALAQTGLKRRTRYGMATLLIGANLPDVDALAYVFGGGVTALSFRRGWTHGVLALLVLPLVLTGLIWAWHRLIGGRTREGEAASMRLGQVALLAAVSVLTHPVLDYMNTYGMRWLMPFGDRWYYADALFIVDPWIWIVLGIGVMLAGREKGEGGTAKGWPGTWQRSAALASLLLVGGYAAAMAAGSAWTRRLVRRDLMVNGHAPVRVLASPVPLNPFRRAIMIDDGDRYRFGTVDWLRRPAFTLDPLVVPVNRDAPAARDAARTPAARAFLGWARFPFFVIGPGQPKPVVHIVDARYTLDPGAGFGAVTIGWEGGNAGRR
jgi:inner membrane protein